MSVKIVNRREFTLEIVILLSVTEGVKEKFYQVLQYNLVRIVLNLLIQVGLYQDKE